MQDHHSTPPQSISLERRTAKKSESSWTTDVLTSGLFAIITLSPISPQLWSTYMGKHSSQSLIYAWDITIFVLPKRISTRPL
jgi:hypothetical protein